jgi:hypothetical protein
MVFGAALVIMMIVRPEGLLPSRQRRAELAEGTGGMGSLGGRGRRGRRPADRGRRGAGLRASARGPRRPGRAGGGSVTGLLELAGVTQRFGGVVALSEIDLSVPEGSIFALIGPNGCRQDHRCSTSSPASTRPPRGDPVRRHGDLRPPAAPGDQAGSRRTFQNIRLFDNMTGARERHGRRRRPGTRPRCSGAAPRPAAAPREERRRAGSRGQELLEFVGHPEGGPRRTAKNLSYGDQRRPGDRPRAGHRPEGCCCSTSRPPG